MRNLTANEHPQTWHLEVERVNGYYRTACGLRYGIAGSTSKDAVPAGACVRCLKRDVPRENRCDVPRGAPAAGTKPVTEYLRGWHDGVAAATRVVEGYVKRGRKVSVRERQEAAPAILGALERLGGPEEM
jgi:hypothetical protein